MTAAPAFTAAARAAVLADAASARAALDEVSAFLARAHGAYADRLAHHVLVHQRRLGDARARYVAMLPGVTIARCPFTGAEVRHSFDPIGLDGLWWDADRPARPDVEPVPGTWLAMTGAVALADPVESTDFLVRPGPAAPAVLPRLLASDDVLAVVRELPVGRHRGFAVTYCSERPAPLLPVNTWGASSFRFTDAAGRAVSVALPVTDGEFDFDLGPWIERGKLRWIAPDDTSHALHDTAGDCPYLDLPGPHETQHLQRGVAWTAATAERARSAP